MFAPRFGSRQIPSTAGLQRLPLIRGGRLSASSTPVQNPHNVQANEALALSLDCCWLSEPCGFFHRRSEDLQSGRRCYASWPVIEADVAVRNCNRDCHHQAKLDESG